MQALVVYESLWGNTKAVAQAIADGFGNRAEAVSTADTDPELLHDVDLLVVGAPILGFTLPTETMRHSIESNPTHKDHPPDISHPSTRSWLKTIASDTGFFATFETKIWWSPGSSAKRIAKSLASAGYLQLTGPESFIVEGTYGPLRDGELERARDWGTNLASLVGIRGVDKELTP